MAGNSQRKGASATGSKKGSHRSGSGGQRPGKRACEGKGPTPKAEDRTKAIRRRKADAAPAARRRSAGVERTGGRPRRRAPPAAARRAPSWSPAATRWSRRCAAKVPATALYVASGIDSRRPGARGAPARRRPRHAAARGRRGRARPADRGALHQGLALQVPPYEYATRTTCSRAAHDAGAAAADRRARRRHRPAQPRRGRPLGRGVRRARRGRPRAARGRHDRGRVEGVGRRRRAGPGGPA